MTQHILFNSFVPSEADYRAADISFMINYYKSIGDSATVAQLLAADVN